MSPEHSKRTRAKKLDLTEEDFLRGSDTGSNPVLQDLVVQVATREDSDVVMRREIMLTDVIVRVLERGSVIDVKALRSAIDSVADRLVRTPLSPERWNTLGLLAYGVGDVHLASSSFQSALRLDSSYPTVQQNLDRARASKQRGTRPLADLDQKLKSAKRAVHEFPRRQAHPTLALAMIVKNEESMLPDCLRSVQGVVDEIIIVDTGSTDRTVEIAQEHGANVLHHEWTNDFAHARNLGLEAVTADWVLVLDADERVHPDDAQTIKQYLNRVWREYFFVPIHNYSGSGEYTTVMDQARIWRHGPERRYKGRIHEQIMWALPNPPSVYGETMPVRVAHYGYLKEILAAKKKSQRNLTLLLEQESDRGAEPFNDYNLGVEFIQLHDYERAVAYLERSWKALKELPDGPVIGYTGMLSTYLARAYRLTGRFGDAVTFLNEAMKVLPGHTDLVLERALVSQRSGDLSSAIKYARAALDMGDTPAGFGGAMGAGTFLPTLLLGEVMLQQGDIDSSIDLTAQALLQYDYKGATGTLVRLRRLRGDAPEKIVSELRTIADENPSTVGVLLANALYEHEDVTSAQAEYEHLANRGLHHNPAVRVGLLECALSVGDLDYVLQNTALDDDGDPLNERLWHFRLFAAFATSDTTEVLRLTTGPIFDQVPAPFQSAARALSGSGRLEVQRAPTSVAVIDQFLRSTLRLQLLEQASTLIEILADSLPIDTRSALLAQTFLDCGYLDIAAEEFATWITESGPSVENLTGLARLELASDRPENAAMIAEDILQIDPTNSTALRIRESRNNENSA